MVLVFVSGLMMSVFLVLSDLKYWISMTGCFLIFLCHVFLIFSLMSSFIVISVMRLIRARASIAMISCISMVLSCSWY